MAGGAASTIRELLVKLGIDADTKSAADFDSAIGKVKESMQALATVAVAVTAALAAGALAMVSQAQATATYAKDVQRSADALGLTTDAYQKLLFAVQKFGGESKDVADVLAKVFVSAKDAAVAGSDAAKMWASLGVSAEKLAAASPDQALALLATGLENVTDPAERLTVANKLLGNDLARKLLPLLVQGADGLKAMGDQAQALGVVMSSGAIATAAKFAEQTTVLSSILTGLRNELGLALIPTLTKLAMQFTDWIGKNRDLISTKIAEYAGRIADAFVITADAISAVNGAIGGLDGWVKLAGLIAGLGATAGVAFVAYQFVALAFAIGEAVIAVAAFVGGGEVLLTIVAAIAAALAGVAALLSVVAAGVLIFQDWITYLEGGDSVFGRLIEKWKTSEGLLGSLARFAEAYGQLWEAVLGRVGQLWDGLLDGMAAAYALGRQFAGWLGVDLPASLGAAAALLGKFVDAMAKITGSAATFIGTPGAVEGAAGAPASALGGSIQGSIGQQAGGLSAGLAPLPRGTSNVPGGRQVSVGGDTITVTGVGLTFEQVEALIASKADQKARATAAAVQSAEV